MIKSNTARNILIILLLFLGLGAIGGGALLIVSPKGKLIGMPLRMLKNSHFDSFLIQGVILFTLLGLAPCLLVVALVKKPKSSLAEKFNFCGDMHWAWTYSIYLSFVLIIWIQLEMVFIQAVSWLHTFYMFFSIVIILTALLPRVRNLYKIKLLEK